MVYGNGATANPVTIQTSVGDGSDTASVAVMPIEIRSFFEDDTITLSRGEPFEFAAQAFDPIRGGIPDVSLSLS